jgi:hypothetical protein
MESLALRHARKDTNPSSRIIITEWQWWEALACQWGDQRCRRSVLGSSYQQNRRGMLQTGGHAATASDKARWRLESRQTVRLLGKKSHLSCREQARGWSSSCFSRIDPGYSDGKQKWMDYLTVIGTQEIWRVARALQTGSSQHDIYSQISRDWSLHLPKKEGNPLLYRLYGNISAQEGRGTDRELRERPRSDLHMAILK